jgi:transcriptional regulator with XRE-family HTH domain
MFMSNKLKEKSVLELLNEQYFGADNKDELDYWEPLSKLILESVELRDSRRMTQADLAKSMNTKQSVISRFENLGRIPSYDFISRLSLALGHSLGMTLYGDYMAIVSKEKQSLVKELADKAKVSTKRFVQSVLDQGIDNKVSVCDNDIVIDATITKMQSMIIEQSQSKPEYLEAGEAETKQFIEHCAPSERKYYELAE